MNRIVTLTEDGDEYDDERDEDGGTVGSGKMRF